MRFIYITLLAILFIMPSNMFASTGDNDEESWQHKVGIIGAITSNATWQLEVSYHWFPIKYVGIGASIGGWQQMGTEAIPSTFDWTVKSDDQSVGNAFFMPSLLFVSPAIIQSDDFTLGITAEPGFMMNVPKETVNINIHRGRGIPYEYKTIQSTNGKWYAFNLRVGIYAKFDPITFSLGYEYSNLDIYAMRRNMQYDNVRFNDVYPKKKKIRGLFLKIDYSF